MAARTQNVRPPHHRTACHFSHGYPASSFRHCRRSMSLHTPPEPVTALSMPSLATAAYELERETLQARRGMLFVQILAPPLPLVCKGSDKEDRVTSSHDLLSSIFGRLLALPEQGRDMLRKAYPEERFDGDWQSHLLRGKHAIALLNTLVQCTESRLVASPTSASDAPNSLALQAEEEEAMYEAFCTYTRTLISLAVGYDMVSSGVVGTAGLPDMQVTP